MANEEKEQNLTEKQKRFCEEYIMEWNGVKAYKAAYKNCKSDAAARTNASRLLTNANIKKYLAELSKDIQKQVGVSKLMVAKEFKKLAFSSGADLRSNWTNFKQWDELTDDEKATIRDVVPYYVQTGDGTFKEILKVVQYDKLKALSGLSKLFRWGEPKEEEEESKAQDRQPIIMDFGDVTNVDLPNNEDEIESIDLDDPLFLED